jgi:hypothetical protein
MLSAVPTDPQDFIFGISALGAFLGGFIFVMKSTVSNKNILKNWMSNKIAVPVQDLSNQIESADIGEVHNKIDAIKEEVVGNRAEIQQIRMELKSDVKELKEDLQTDIAGIKATVDEVGRSVANLTGQLTVMQGGFWHPDPKV